jgi:hypothetical protein
VIPRREYDPFFGQAHCDMAVLSGADAPVCLTVGLADEGVGSAIAFLVRCRIELGFIASPQPATAPAHAATQTR